MPADTISFGDVQVHRLGFGAMRITGRGIWGAPPDRDRAIRVLRDAVHAGVQIIDTADSYGPSTSEELIAEALHPYPEDLLIATKAGFDRPAPWQWVPNGRPEHLRQAVEGSLSTAALRAARAAAAAHGRSSCAARRVAGHPRRAPTRGQDRATRAFQRRRRRTDRGPLDRRHRVRAGQVRPDRSHQRAGARSMRTARPAVPAVAPARWRREAAAHGEAGGQASPRRRPPRSPSHGCSLARRSSCRSPARAIRFTSPRTWRRPRWHSTTPTCGRSTPPETRCSQETLGCLPCCTDVAGVHYASWSACSSLPTMRSSEIWPVRRSATRGTTPTARPRAPKCRPCSMPRLGTSSWSTTVGVESMPRC